jgi:hypothetical protein
MLKRQGKTSLKSYSTFMIFFSGELYNNLHQTRCPLLLVADYRFFNEMGGGSSKTTVNYLISLIDRSVGYLFRLDHKCRIKRRIRGIKLKTPLLVKLQNCFSS